MFISCYIMKPDIRGKLCLVWEQIINNLTSVIRAPILMILKKLGELIVLRIGKLPCTSFWFLFFQMIIHLLSTLCVWGIFCCICGFRDRYNLLSLHSSHGLELCSELQAPLLVALDHLHQATQIWCYQIIFHWGFSFACKMSWMFGQCFLTK